MLIEWWERLRGYDKWVEAEATVESSRIEMVPSPGRGSAIKQNDDVLIWTDNNGERHRAYFEVQGVDTSLYELDKGSKIRIRYNPADPDQYYLRELLKKQVIGVVYYAFAAVTVTAIFIVVVRALFHN